MPAESFRIAILQLQLVLRLSVSLPWSSTTEFAGVRSILPISKGGTRNQAIPEGPWELGNKHYYLVLKISVISIGPQATEYCRVL